MIALYFLMGALALLVAIVFLGFVGCTPFGTASSPDPEPPPLPPPPPPPTPPPPTPPDYGAYGNWVTRTPDLVAYWRLGEPATTTVLKASDPIPAGAVKTAKDTFNGFHGYYFKLNPVATPDNPRHSPPSTGEIILGVTPGLLKVAPQESYPCLQVTGGFVQVPWANQLNPQEFTLEAWVSPNPNVNPKYYYCLVESSGPQGLGQKKTGWGLYLGPDEDDEIAWQVWMGDGAKFNQVAIAKPNRTQLTLTYLALTFDGNQKLQLWVYYPNTEQDLDLLEVPALEIPDPIVFQPNDSTAAGKGDFLIGAGSNLFPNVGAPPQRLYPFHGKIQEVALYKRDLSAPNNTGVQTTLASHELAGGDI
jgi:hypothetical protein